MAVLAAPGAVPIRRLSSQSRVEAFTGQMFALPALLLIVGLLLVPILVVAVLGFSDYQLGAIEWSWIGLGNYERMLDDPVFWRSIGNTFLYVAVVVPGSVLSALVVAILVNDRKHFKSVYQIIYFLPVTTTLIAMSVVWHFVLNPQLGPIAGLLRALGLPPVDLFGDLDLVLIALSLIGIWQLVGFNMVLFLAGLTAIPRDLYDAAAIDGADHPWDRFARVTWPMLGPTTVFVVVTTTITAFRVFDTVAVITRGGPIGRSEVMLYAIYLEGFQYFEIGYASALTIVFLVVVVALAVLQAFFLDRKVHY
ncbi:ABC transporter permease [Pleomorphomonas diazotrophica]|uniref:ABC transporter permease n=2 Tax=Pleomorphomonas diazotrophica TaxID=1166257 RepID=A0A1I4WBZ2_9HYPH|nr:sugar ABC transporter permease [Pleomorphomonas diazotrophica]PKR89037.1 ABC transporter permease [Pleomorphomonas diazotrophica]SFN10746.1 carbohydrate ABC transporter membrane protein 1, CUT1 family [Pleomorphomonas diazotrophica]